MNRVTRISRRNIRGGRERRMGVSACRRALHHSPLTTPPLQYSAPRTRGRGRGRERRSGGRKTGTGHPKERELDILLTPLCLNNPLSHLTTETLSRSSASEFGRCPTPRLLRSSVTPSLPVIV